MRISDWSSDVCSSDLFRMLRAIKNRFGETDEVGVFAMGDRGLDEVPNPSMLFLTSRDQPVPGSVVFPALEGTRPVLVEIQALEIGRASCRERVCQYV